MFQLIILILLIVSSLHLIQVGLRGLKTSRITVEGGKIGRVFDRFFPRKRDATGVRARLVSILYILVGSFFFSVCLLILFNLSS